ncbi:type IV pilus assembly protein PilM [Candidatus Uhrbacteria bacterium]|nr:type IV pilus assembly protein PilM [Candidatus Uhrbacteria bacterium]
MGLFGGAAKKRFVGIDLGSSGIKAVELLNEKGRARLMTYGYSQSRSGENLFSPLERPKEAADLLVKVCKQAGIGPVKAVAALPMASVFSAVISVPREKDEKHLKEAINVQVRKLTPMPLEEMITYSTFIDPWKHMPKAKDASKPSDAPSADHVRVLVTGTAKSMVQKYLEVFKLAKVELQAIDTEAFALIRSLVGKDKGTVLILDVGHTQTNLSIVDKGVPFLNRSMHVGGAVVTDQIASQLGISVDQAEQMKHDLGTSAAPGAEGGSTAFLDSLIQPILHEIRYAFDLYARMELTESKRVEKIILTGGSSHLPQIDVALSRALNLNVYRGDPWARVVVPEALRSVLDEVGPRLSVAVGLAMREID